MKGSVRIAIYNPVSELEQPLTDELTREFGSYGMRVSFFGTGRPEGAAVVSPRPDMTLLFALPEAGSAGLGKRHYWRRKPFYVCVAGKFSDVFRSIALDPYSVVRRDSYREDIADTVRAYVGRTGNGKGGRYYICGGASELFASEILYVRPGEKGVLVTCRSGQALPEPSCTMRMAERALEGCGFIRIGEDCLLNCRRIHAVIGDTVVLETGERFTMEESRAEKARQGFVQFVWDNNEYSL